MYQELLRREAMKFVADPNPKKVRIVPESDDESAWVATLSEGGKRVKRGAERFVLKAFNEWRRNPPKLDISGLASAMMGGPKAPTKAEKAADAIEALKAEGREALAVFDDAMGIMCREARGILVRVANELHQRLYRQPFPYSYGTREDRAWQAADWLRGIL